MKCILGSTLLVASMLVSTHIYAHCGKCASDTCQHCACLLETEKQDCEAMTECTCGKECTCVKAKCPCVKKRCCNKKGKVEKHEKHTHHHEHQEKQIAE